LGGVVYGLRFGSGAAELNFSWSYWLFTIQQPEWGEFGGSVDRSVVALYCPRHFLYPFAFCWFSNILFSAGNINAFAFSTVSWTEDDTLKQRLLRPPFGGRIL
jgi:hypothetical protein